MGKPLEDLCDSWSDEAIEGGLERDWGCPIPFLMAEMKPSLLAQSQKRRLSTQAS